MNTESIPTSEIAAKVSDLSRVWIYQSDREFTDSEYESISRKSQQFIEKWKAHGTRLKADYALLFNRFLCLFADESDTGASGCSIDSSVNFVKSLENEFNVNFMNRNEVAVLKESQIVTVYNLNDLPRAAEEDEIDEHTLVFNNLVKTKGEMNKSWLLPIKESWHNRFLT